MKHVIGLVGRIGSGKTVVSEYLQKEYNGKEYRFSQILEDVLKRLRLPVDRTNLQKLGACLRRDFGEDVILNVMKKDINASRSSLLIIDGIRYDNEAEMLQSQERNVLIFITASPDVRYARCVERGGRGEENLTYKEFLKNERAETEKRISNLSEISDYIIDNNGTKEDLINQVNRIMRNEGMGHASR
jgi:dephospho-CoA kinase